MRGNVAGIESATCALDYFYPCLASNAPNAHAHVLQVSAAGLLVCLVSSFLSTDLFPVKEEKDIEWVS